MNSSYQSTLCTFRIMIGFCRERPITNVWQLAEHFEPVRHHLQTLLWKDTALFHMIVPNVLKLFMYTEINLFLRMKRYSPYEVLAYQSICFGDCDSNEVHNEVEITPPRRQPIYWNSEVFLILLPSTHQLTLLLTYNSHSSFYPQLAHCFSTPLVFGN